MTHKLWVDDEEILHTDLNQLVAQTVSRFATEIDRDAAIGVPTAGMLCYVPSGYQEYDGSDWIPLVAVPPGGTTGQVLAKASNDDYAVEWVTP